MGEREGAREVRNGTCLGVEEEGKGQGRSRGREGECFGENMEGGMFEVRKGGVGPGQKWKV